MPQKKLTPIEKELKERSFRVVIFGSARTGKKDKEYREVFNLAKSIGKRGFDLVTGGGPGLMEAANSGHSAGDPKKKSEDIGLPIKLPWENKNNKYLEVSRKFSKFSDRLDHFMALASIVVVMPGGVGTCLEFFYTWQLIQVKHIKPVPIILVGTMWRKLMKWIKNYPLKKGLISPNELESIHVAKNNREAIKIIDEAHQRFSHGKKYDNRDYL
jgi:uncharacterized protein (TIGR00730 family)